jgi:hypothetical protein
VETVVALVSAVEQQTRYVAMTFMFTQQHHHLVLEVAVTVLVDGMPAMELVNR